MVTYILTISNTTHQIGDAKSISIAGDPYKVTILPRGNVVFDLINVQFDERFLDVLYNLSESGSITVSLNGSLLTSTEVGNLKYGGTPGGVGTDYLVKVGAAGTPDYLSSTYFDQALGTNIRPVQRIDDTLAASDKVWSSTKVDTELSTKTDIKELRVVFKERFVGTGAQTAFTLTNAILNATFSTGSWSVARVLNTLPSHATKTTKKVLYDNVNLFTRNRIEVSSINGSGVATLSFPPILGESFDLWYWYEVQTTDVIDDYYREDFIATMEAASDKTASQVPTDITNFNNILGVGDTTVQLSLDTIDDHTHDHSTLTNLSTGADHSYIDQDVTSGASSILDGTNFTGIPNGALVETYINADGTVPLSGAWDAGGYEIRALTFESDVAIGTAPFTITSTTLNTNLNADLLDGQHGAHFLSRAEWKQNGFENQADSTITFTDGSRTLSVQPTGANFNYWMEGVQYISTGDTVIIDNTDGAHVIYYDGAVLTALVHPTLQQLDVIILTKAIVSFVVWNVSAVEGVYVGEERHGKVLSPSSHSYHHNVDGLRYGFGLGLNTMSVDGTGITIDAQFGTDAGAAADEDLFFAISAVVSTTGLPIYHMIGATAIWTRTVVAGFSARTFDNTSATRLAYNQYTGGAWQLTQVPNNDFVLYHIFATTEKDKPMISVMGQAVYGNIAAARQGALVEIQSILLVDTIFPEMRPIATVIFQTNLAYVSAINGKIRSTDDGDDYIDWRSETVSRSVISTSDHSALTGLGTDDHTQYVLVDGTRSMTGGLLAPIFDTNVAAAGLTFSGTTLAADGTDAAIDITLTPKGNAGIVLPDAAGAPAVTTNKLFQTASLLNFNDIVLAGSSTNQTGTLILDDGVNWRVTLIFSNGALSSVTTGASTAALASWV